MAALAANPETTQQFHPASTMLQSAAPGQGKGSVYVGSLYWATVFFYACIYIQCPLLLTLNVCAHAFLLF